MDFAVLLRSEDIAPKDVAVLFHASDRPALHRVLPWLAEERPDLFNAYQNNHGPQAEAVVKKRRFLAAFVNTSGRDYTFVGLFEITGATFKTLAELEDHPLRAELRDRFGDGSYRRDGQDPTAGGRLEFSLTPCTALAPLIGRLVVEKPEGRAYARLAENLSAPVVEITRERRLVQPAPDWRDFVVTADEIRSLPREWAARLREWRGVYLICDQTDGARYIGSASGVDNLFGRWKAHVGGAKGITAELARRDPGNFRFSILERLHPDLPSDAVIAVERNWKWRLDTLAHGLNRN